MRERLRRPKWRWSACWPSPELVRTDQDTVVVGAGIVGLAVARAVLLRHPGSDVLIVDKEREAARHQTGHNSGVIHAGESYKPGSAKAQLCVTGARQLVEFCRRHAVPLEVRGKLIVAVAQTELAGLDELERRATANGVDGVRRVSAADITTIEPHAAGIAALHLPTTGVTDFSAVARSLLAECTDLGGSVQFGFRVAGLSSARSGGVRLVRDDGQAVTCRRAVVCAGAQGDRLAGSADLRIVPFRGSYFRIRPEAAPLVTSMIYPVPDPQFPFLGVHFTRLIHGGIEAGPNAVLAFAREGYRKTDVNLGDLWDALSYRGLWRFLQRYPGMAWFELRRSFSRDLFCRSLQRLVPGIRPDDLVTGGSGVRAQVIAPEGEIVQDFQFIARPKALHVLNAPSPAATASLAIGAEIAGMIPEK